MQYIYASPEPVIYFEYIHVSFDPMFLKIIILPRSVICTQIISRVEFHSISR